MKQHSYKETISSRSLNHIPLHAHPEIKVLFSPFLWNSINIPSEILPYAISPLGMNSFLTKIPVASFENLSYAETIFSFTSNSTK